MASPILAFKTLITSQKNKIDDINENYVRSENAANRTTLLTIAGDSTIPSTAFQTYVAFDLAGTPAAFDLNVPAVPRVFIVDNDTSVTATVQVTGGGGAGASVLSGEIKWVKSDGTDCKVV